MGDRLGELLLEIAEKEKSYTAEREKVAQSQKTLLTKNKALNATVANLRQELTHKDTKLAQEQAKRRRITEETKKIETRQKEDIIDLERQLREATEDLRKERQGTDAIQQEFHTLQMTLSQDSGEVIEKERPTHQGDFSRRINSESGEDSKKGDSSKKVNSDSEGDSRRVNNGSGEDTGGADHDVRQSVRVVRDEDSDSQGFLGSDVELIPPSPPEMVVRAMKKSNVVEWIPPSPPEMAVRATKKSNVDKRHSDTEDCKQ